MYQMRAADEAHTSVWSCDMCPLDPSKISFSRPRKSTLESFPRMLHARSASEPKYASRKQVKASSIVEIRLPAPPRSLTSESSVKNRRVPCSVPDPKYATPARAYYHCSGMYSNEIVRDTGSERLSPNCNVKHVALYRLEEESALGEVESDGIVFTLASPRGMEAYFYSRMEGGRGVHSLAMDVGRGWEQVSRAMLSLYHYGLPWPGIEGFVSRDYLSTINNLSPRAWDSRRIQKKGAYYTPKVDGERVYVLIFSGVMHVFAKSKGYPHIGCRPLLKMIHRTSPVVIDAENTVSHGILLIDMLTDHGGKPSPRERDYKWSLDQMERLQNAGEGIPIKVKPYSGSLLEAEEMSRSALYPTDGVIALWPGTTTSRKMKLEKSIELLVGQNNGLYTSDGDVVFSDAGIPTGVHQGDIVEVRLKLCSNGKDVTSKPIFKRVDKVKANGTSAVMAVLSSFSSVRRDDETRRREVLMWCDSLKQHLINSALERKGSRKVVIDVGTGTGQSLDILRPDKGVSYLLIEPSEEKCAMLRRRVGRARVIKEPREIMSAIRPLKSGSQTYVIANMELSQLSSDEELMKFVGEEVAFVSCTFSAHFVTAELYDVCSYWQIPMVGCMYTYDDVEVGGALVDTLGVSMKRKSESECTVRWGGDEEYTEPYTTTQEYEPFCTVTRAIDIVPPPNKESDPEAWSICSKVYMIENFQGL